MKFAVLGTGVVGQTIGNKLVALGHEVKMGGREPVNPTGQNWAGSAGPLASYGSFQQAARFGVNGCAIARSDGCRSAVLSTGEVAGQIRPV